MRVCLSCPRPSSWGWEVRAGWGGWGGDGQEGRRAGKGSTGGVEMGRRAGGPARAARVGRRHCRCTSMCQGAPCLPASPRTDFIFYSVLVGRAAMYDFLTVFACYLAIIAGARVGQRWLAHAAGGGAAHCLSFVHQHAWLYTPDQQCLLPNTPASTSPASGLGCTLLWLAMARKALPALPISIVLAVTFYFLSRFVLEPILLPQVLELVYY